MIGNRMQVHPMSEAELKASVVKLAHDMGWMVFSMPQAGRHPRSVKSASGYPDLTLARNGRVLWFELKRDKASMSQDQLDWMRHLRNAHTITPGALRDGTVARLLA